MDAEAYQLAVSVSDPRRAAAGMGCGLCRLSPGPLGRCRSRIWKSWRRTAPRRAACARKAAFWAARAHMQSGDPQKVVTLLAAAAKEEPTFYGLIAERMLGMDTKTGFSDAVLSARTISPP